MIRGLFYAAADAVAVIVVALLLACVVAFIFWMWVFLRAFAIGFHIPTGLVDGAGIAVVAVWLVAAWRRRKL